jgi:nucleotide-binding universal stress UspA family protein
MNLSCIVCATDGAETSPAVLAYARTLAQRDNAELQVVHLADVRGGDPAAAVVDHARRVRADLIVAGATLVAPGVHGLGWLAEAIARNAHAPTMVVPLVPQHKREELSYRNILCPVDFSPGSVRAYAHAFDLAQHAGGTVTLLHMLDELPERLIVAEARRLDADLIVMSLTAPADAAPERPEFMVGRIAAQAACPVLVLHETEPSPAC